MCTSPGAPKAVYPPDCEPGPEADQSANEDTQHHTFSPVQRFNFSRKQMTIVRFEIGV